MKKVSLLFMAMVAAFALQAQWTDNPAQNSIIAINDTTQSITVSGIHTMTDAVTNDTYVQWLSMGGGNGFAPTLQRLTADGTPQWGESGIRFSQFNFSTHSAGVSLAITPNHDVLSCFSTADHVTVALRFHPDGTYAWGEQGITLFGGNGGYRAEIIAGSDGGAWTLGSDNENLYLQYVNADGTLNPLITIEPDNDTIQYMFGKLTLRDDNSVFLTYEHNWVQPGSYSNWGTKEIHLTGYAVDGTQTISDVVLLPMVDCITTYNHSVEPDGLGGAYAYISVVCDSINPTFKTLVFHHDANGSSTISDPYGANVHSDDPHHYYIGPYVSVDPVTHDLLIAYLQTNTDNNENKVYANRITATGERVWDEGLLVYEAGDPLYALSTPSISAFEDGSGFAVTYFRLDDNWDTKKYTIEAAGYDINCNVLWNKQLCSNNYAKTLPETISGFHNGQNIIAWGKLDKNIIYGQNFGIDGSMGQGLDVEEIFEDEEEIVNVVSIFNVNGQLMQSTNLNELNTGVYIIQGETESGKIVNKKIVLTKK